jgi:hypothetical protein
MESVKPVASHLLLVIGIWSVLLAKTPIILLHSSNRAMSIVPKHVQFSLHHLLRRNAMQDRELLGFPTHLKENL